MKYPESFDQLVQYFEMYPGIGPKTAERLAMFTITKLDKEKVRLFAQALNQAISKIKTCHICGTITDQEICDICLDETREPSLLVVEQSKDVIAFEKLNHFNGKYHVLAGTISPINGIGPEDIQLSSLLKRIEEEKIKEVILALPSTIPGEMTSLYIQKMVEKMEVSVYRIGYGLPVGADIEYADEITLKKALEGKKKL
ncbi:MAG: recombination mediator RecR [Bacilli bacterium]|jgi:recombination protein RecR|nr:recombination mediator RecR [Bacilli bacterium]MDY0063706.1 recombination mediator RecR [Bacilli bacterium]